MRSPIILCSALIVAVGITLLPNRLFRGMPLLKLDRVSVSTTKKNAATGGTTAAGGTVYVTLSPECPISRGYIPTLNRLHEEWLGNGVDLIGVIPEVPAATTDVDEFRTDFRIAFPLAVDRRGRLCQQLEMTHMPEAVLVNRAGTVLYRGRIDDRYVRIADAPRKIREHSLENAVGRFRGGHMTQKIVTQAIGCRIESPVTTTAGQSSGPTFSSGPTYSTDVAGIVYSRCLRCHREGEAAPFAMASYEDVVSHAAQIREVVTQRVMPPWQPSARVGAFRNDCRLSDTEIRTIVEWIDSGLAEGDSDLAPTPPEFASGWQMGTPDVELLMPQPFSIPADGPDLYQHFVIPTGITRNRLIRGFEFRPGASEVVHHAFLFYDTTGEGRRLDAEDPGPGYSRVGSPGFAVSGSLGGWGPGGLPNELPIGMGRPLPANSDLVLQVHYHPCGKRVVDQSRIGLYFAEDWAQRYVTTVMVADVDLEIPAGAAEHHHYSEWRLPVDTIVLDVSPHMHVLGKSVRVDATLPSGDVLPLVEIKNWNFYWQDNYVFQQPLELPAGTLLRLQCVFDNSEANPLNPNSPPQDVFWGDFSDDEMAIAYLQATTRTLDDYKLLNSRSQEYFDREFDRYQRQKSQRIKKGIGQRKPDPQ